MQNQKKRDEMEQSEQLRADAVRLASPERPAPPEVVMPAARPVQNAGRVLPLRPYRPLPVAQTQHESDVPEADAGPSTPVHTITDEDVVKADEVLQKYREGKKALEGRVRENVKWYRQRHWDVVGRSKNEGDPEPASAWLFNCLANKHADYMDNYPSPVVLPRESMDKQDAETLTSILPVVMEQNDYEQTYDDTCWDTLITGMSVQGVFWDKKKLNGIGDIAIKPIDVLNLYWEPGCTDLQQSANVFSVELRNAEALRMEYPQLEDVAGLNGTGSMLARHENDENIDVQTKALVVDWYYKRRNMNGKTVLHYCKYCAGKLLYASENDERYRERGYYDHGQYPFVVDGLFPIKDQLGGFGYVDIMKSPQIYIDKLDQSMLKNTVLGAKPRWWVKNDGSVNTQQYADMSNDFVKFTGSGNPNDSIFPIQPPPMNTYAITLRANKIDELKETSGNRDFSQGGTASGITAASAIAALQEAGSKLSRDMIKEKYRAYRKVCELCIELIRQFYTAPREFRITGKQGQQQFAKMSGAQTGLKQTGDNFMQTSRMPVFDVQVVAQKSSPFSTVVQNERAKELYAAGFFRPDMADQALMCLSMMQFDGIEEIKNKISQNSTLFKMQQQIAPIMMQMAMELDQIKKTTQYAQQVQMLLAQAMGMQGAMPMGGMQMGAEPQANSLGAAISGARNSTAGEARKQAANNAAPR